MDLVRNQIGDPGAQALAEALPQNSSLTKLDLYGNEIGDEGAQAIATALQNNLQVTVYGLN